MEKTGGIMNSPRVGIAREKARSIITDIGIKNPPILLGHIINFLNVNSKIIIKSWDFPKSIDGINFLNGEKIVIGYNQNVGYFRKRFTIAHELGHFLLGHLVANHRINFEDNNLEDIEANQFAAELLIPLQFIREDFKNNQNIKELSVKYLVSEEAMGWKLYDQKII